MLTPMWAPLVLRSQGVREVTARSLKPQTGQGAGVLPTRPGGAAGPWNPFLGQAPQGAGTEDSLCAMVSAASWLKFKYRFCHFLPG